MGTSAASTPQRSVSSSRAGQKFTSLPPSAIKSASTTAVGNANRVLPLNATVPVSITSNAPTRGDPSVSRTIASIPITISTVVSWTVIRPSSTTTLTAHAETTLSSPIAITSTNSSNRQKFVSTPAFLTVWSTSTNSRGAMVTFTQIAANPLANFNETSSSFDRSGLLHNQGAVAGVFAAIGLVAAAIIALLVLFARRRRRLNRRKRRLPGMQQRPDFFAGSPFPGPLSAPMMRNSENKDAHRRRGIGPLSIDYKPSASGNGKIGSAGRLTVDGGLHVFGQNNASQAAYFDGTGLAINELNKEFTRLSLALPTSSIYPLSLPPVEGDVDRNEQGTETTPPPRPPRSMLRKSAAGLLDYHPTTPPDYTPSDNYSSPSSLTTDQQHVKSSPIFNRRTLLDVRARPTKSDGRNN